MFRAFGHENSSVLNGGLPAWEAGGLPLENGAPESEPSPQDYPLPEYDSNIVASAKDITFMNY
jgi:thiosulfate/3-mercaptopyruvate sulfurtransferase